MPDQSMRLLVIKIEATSVSDARLGSRLRLGIPTIMARLRGNELEFNLLTLFEHQEPSPIEAR